MAGLRSSLLVWMLLTVGLSNSLAGAAEPPLPKETGKKQADSAMQPLDVLADCIVAIESGDYRRYVGHLTPEEQKAQAGYALFLTEVLGYMGNVLNNEDSAQSLLLARGLQDLADKYLVPKNQLPNETHRNAAKAMDQLRSMAFVPGGHVGPSYPGPAASVPGQLLTLLTDSAGQISDVSAYLAAAVEEAARPTVTQASGKSGRADTGRAAEKDDQPLDLLAHIKKMKWTLYVRGNNAIAISKQVTASLAAPRPGAHPQPVPVPVPTAGPYGPAIQAPPIQAPPQSQPAVVRSAKTYRVEFKRRSGSWKISRLLPSDIVSAVTPALAAVACTQPTAPLIAQPAHYPYYTPSRSAGAPQPAAYSTPSVQGYSAPVQSSPGTAFTPQQPPQYPRQESRPPAARSGR